MKKLLPSWKRCGVGFIERGKQLLQRKLYWFVKRKQGLPIYGFVVLHLPLDLNAVMMFNIFTSHKTSSYILWTPSQGP
jgi:hypothetical protein